jgi:hypothetical protein
VKASTTLVVSIVDEEDDEAIELDSVLEDSR